MNRPLWMSFLPLMISLPGCLTVGMDTEFLETTEHYHEDGTLESLTETRWTQNAKGGPFTDIEHLKQDTRYAYEGPEGEKYDIGQGSGASGVMGDGQVEALSAALAGLSSALNQIPGISVIP